MKHLFQIISIIALVGFAVSCKTTKSSVSVQGKSETLSQSSERLYTSLATDSLSKFFALNADSLVITFATGELFPSCFENTSNPSGDPKGSPDDMYFLSQPDAERPTALPSPPFGRVRVGMYGLHASTGSSKQSIQQSSLANSIDKSEQSASIKEDNVKKSSPFSFSKALLIAALVATLIIVPFFFFRNLHR